MKSEHQKRIRRVVGDFVKIRLDDNWHAYARVLDEPLFAFYNCKTGRNLTQEEIKKHPVLFKIWVMKSAVTSGRWPVIGNRPLENSEKEIPAFFKRDALNPKSIFIYHNGAERKATPAECFGLECAAAWSAEHVEDRLRDHFMGRPNKWVASLKISGGAAAEGT